MRIEIRSRQGLNIFAHFFSSHAARYGRSECRAYFSLLGELGIYHKHLLDFIILSADEKWGWSRAFTRFFPLIDPPKRRVQVSQETHLGDLLFA